MRARAPVLTELWLAAWVVHSTQVYSTQLPHNLLVFHASATRRSTHAYASLLARDCTVMEHHADEPNPDFGEGVHPAEGRCTLHEGTEPSSHATTPARRAMRSRGGGCAGSKTPVSPAAPVQGGPPPRQAQSASKEAQIPIPDLDVDLRKALSTLDNRLVKVLRDGDIRLLRSSWLLEQPDDYRIGKRQDLEELEMNGATPSPLLSPDEAVELIRKGTRSAGVLSYGCTLPLLELPMCFNYQSATNIISPLLTLTPSLQGHSRATQTPLATASGHCATRSTRVQTSRRSFGTFRPYFRSHDPKTKMQPFNVH